MKLSYVIILSLVVSNAVVVESRPKWKQQQTRHVKKSHQVTLETICPHYPSNRKYCTQVYNQCREDRDCGVAVKCCFDGCIYTCTEPVIKQPKVIDWLKKPTAQRVSGNGWLIEGKSQKKNKIMCSTSNFTGFEPLLCPTAYICDVNRDEDISRNIPNRGLCIPDPYKEIDPFEPQEWTYTDAYKNTGGCSYKSKHMADGQYFFNGCNFCFCTNGIINCQLTPCSTSKPKSFKLAQTENSNFIKEYIA